MSAEILRRAASLMRDRAETATPGPWQIRETMHAEFVVCDRTGWLGAVSNPATGRDDYGKANAMHIASWHPAVALAVAAWLDASESAHSERTGDDCGQGYTSNGYGYVDPSCSTCGTPDEYAEPWPCAPFKQALAVARAYLGEPS